MTAKILAKNMDKAQNTYTRIRKKKLTKEQWIAKFPYLFPSALNHLRFPGRK
jgi:hypothetical protein